MDEGDDPYRILGVNKDATAQQIKTAYRKLALRHHPDKQSTDDARQTATVEFAKISNAYEIVGDEKNRKQFDRSSSQSSMPRQSSRSARHHDMDDFFHHAHFHDPFSVFESVFREEFGGDFFGRRSNNNGMRGGGRRSVFDDPFFGGGGGFGASPFGGSMFGEDPFFGGGGMMGGGGDPFFGGGGGSLFSRMNDMMNMHQRMAQQQQNASLPQQQQNGQSVVYSTTSSRSLGGGAGGGESVSTSTTTRIINGKRQQVTERILQKADGTVERHVETDGDDDFPQLDGRYGGGQRQALLGWQQQQQQQQQQQRLPAEEEVIDLTSPEYEPTEAMPKTKPRKGLMGRLTDHHKRKRRNSSKSEREDA